MQNVRRLSISNLNFLMVDPNTDLETKKNAEKELDRRCLKAGWSSRNLYECDFYKIRQRGFDIDKYLIGSKPSMQLLMELYFSYLYDDSDNMLLFSEKHFYNNSSFFNQILMKEIKNLDDRIKIENNERLQYIKDVFLKVLHCEKEKKKNSITNELIKNNDIFRALCEERIKIGMNFDATFLKIIGYNENSMFSIASDLMAIFHDSNLLHEQKRLLLAESSIGCVVDYGSSVIEKKLIRKK